MGTFETGQDANNGELRINEESVQILQPEVLAKRPTGPRTATGKKRASINALKYGIFAGEPLTGSEKATYKKLAEEVRHFFQVQDALGEQLVIMFVSVVRRQDRLRIAEGAEILKQSQSDEKLRREAIDIEDRIHLKQSERGLLEHLQNPFIVDRCLELLTRWRERVCLRGYDSCFDVALIRKLYGSLRAEEMDTRLQYKLQIVANPESERPDAKEDGETNKVCTDLIEKLEDDIEFVERAKRVLKDIRKQSAICEKDTRLIAPPEFLDRIIRYGAHLSREYDRIWNRLERYRSLRAGHPAPPQLNIEVHNDN
jgi:hypothetical protein